ncbi:MAG: type II toxin-antitoxin system PemK/MazF family toxin [Actinomycetota bacterium]
MRGDVVRLPAARGAAGRELKGARYGVVVQGDDFELLSTVVVVPTSRSAQPRSFRPTVTVGGTDTQVLPEQIRSLDRQRIRNRVGHLAPAEMKAVDEALRAVFDLPRR